MKKKFGFSLAEALITLLIVSIIAIVSAPVVTKKSRRIDNKTIWTINTDNYATITPTDGRDLKIGKTRSGKTQGIVIVDRLEFKNQNGEVIGWINEDGSTSFSGVSNEMLHEELESLLRDLSKDMQNMLSMAKSSTRQSIPASSRHPISTAKQRHQINTAHKRHPIDNYTNKTNQTLTPEQAKEMEMLTNEIFKLLEMNNR